METKLGGAHMKAMLDLHKFGDQHVSRSDYFAAQKPDAKSGGRSYGPEHHEVMHDLVTAGLVDQGTRPSATPKRPDVKYSLSPSGQRMLKPIAEHVVKEGSPLRDAMHPSLIDHAKDVNTGRKQSTLQTGSKGGKFYITSNGSKVYLGSAKSLSK